MGAAIGDETASGITDALVRMGLVEEGFTPVLEPMTGGVSSDIFRVATQAGFICVKRARARLRTDAAWEVPVERNRYEYEWLQTVAGIDEGSVPTLLGRDDHAGLFAMAYLDPADHPVWKAQLLAGEVHIGTAAQVGDLIGRIHAATADSVVLAERFATDDLFRSLRLDPYLATTASVHPDLAPIISGIADTTASTRRVLVHGDVSPKNLLVGPGGPVVLDAECAWYGDPAFDIAFCLNHLLLKAFHRPADGARYLASFDALTDAYLDHVSWEDSRAVETRAARLLPALLLARVDGTSPVEYLDSTARGQVRRVARDLLAAADDSLAAVSGAVASLVAGLVGSADDGAAGSTAVSAGGSRAGSTAGSTAGTTAGSDIGSRAGGRSDA